MLMIVNKEKYEELKKKEKLADKLAILNYAKSFELDYMTVIVELVKQLGGKAIIDERCLLNKNEFIEVCVNQCNMTRELRVKIIEEVE